MKGTVKTHMRKNKKVRGHSRKKKHYPMGMNKAMTKKDIMKKY